VQILNTIADLPEHAINLWATHLAGHDHAEEVVWCIFHDLIVVSMVTNNVDRFDDVGVFECRTNAKFRGDFLLVLLLGLSRALGPKLLNGKYMTTVFVAGFYEAHCTTCTGAQDATPFPVLLGYVGLGSPGKRINGLRMRGCTET
jgi:hypothetical protein